MKRMSLTLFLLFLCSNLVFAKGEGAPPMTAGVPTQRTCATSKCHGDREINMGPGEVIIKGLPPEYVPGEVYDLVIEASHAKIRTWGFQATMADKDGNPLGTFILPDAKDLQLLDQAEYQRFSSLEFVTHTKDGLRGPRKGQSPAWTFQWKAPAEAGAAGRLYVMVNAANGNRKKSGDWIYSQIAEVVPAGEAPR